MAYAGSFSAPIDHAPVDWHRAPRSSVGAARVVAVLLAACVCCAATLSLTSSRGSERTPAAAAASERATDAFRKLPLAFTPNAGQSADRVRYLAQGAGFGFYFLRDRVVLDLRRGSEPSAGPEGVALHLRFVGANPAVELAARERAPGSVNYLRGGATGSQTGLASYRELVYRELWPGIDMAFRGQGGRLKYEFRVARGADPSAIRLAYAGAEGLSLGPAGALRIDTALGTMRDSRPVSYQRSGGRRVPVESSYALGRGGYRFALGAYEPGRPLVIDPGLAYSTVLGGADLDQGTGVAVDAAGRAHVTGTTSSADFPTTAGAYDESRAGGRDAFVAKLDEAGTELVYSTYLGGDADDFAGGIALDLGGQAHITGSTSSADFPTTMGAYDDSHNGSDDAFVAKLNTTGTALLYSTYLGGGASEVGADIAIDEVGQAHVAGDTDSADFPVTPGAHDETLAGLRDAFVTTLDASGTGLVYSTYLGGGSSEFGAGIAVEPTGQAYVTGDTHSADFPVTFAHDETLGGFRDAFVTKLSAGGTTLVYSTYLGGGSGDSGHGIAVDAGGQAYVTGQTISVDFPTTAGAYDESHNDVDPATDAFVTKLDATGDGLVYSTYLGGGTYDRGFGIAVDAAGQAYVTGDTQSSDFPTTAGAHDVSHEDVSEPDAFMTKLNTAGATLAYSTYLGGGDVDQGFGIALGAAGQAYVIGLTLSASFPTTAGALDRTHNGGEDAFVAKVDTLPPQCADAADNDGDGKIDYPADRQCESASDPSERPQCSDGLDNDGDGKRDYPDDPGCRSAADNSEANPQCSDDLDNDGDDKVDYPEDPGCSSARDNSEVNPQCSDGLDNDGDDKFDYPEDPGCTSAADNNETNPQCFDGIDNDGDGDVDYPQDSGCRSRSDNSENTVNAAPKVTLVTDPGPGEPFQFGDTIAFEVMVTDDAPVDCSKVSVAHLLRHGLHMHPQTTTAGCTGTFTTVVDEAHAGATGLAAHIDAVYTDAGGLQGSDAVEVPPNP